MQWEGIGVPHLGPMELLLILVIIMVVFGVGRLPEVGGAIGKGLREFRQAQLGLDEFKDELSKPIESEEEKS